MFKPGKTVEALFDLVGIKAKPARNNIRRAGILGIVRPAQRPRLRE
jgi:hypothetical protein